MVNRVSVRLCTNHILLKIQFWVLGTIKFRVIKEMAFIVESGVPMWRVLNFAAIWPPYLAPSIYIMLPLDESPGWKLCICHSKLEEMS